MARELKKTNPIGVRFDKDLLDGITLAGLADSPQKVLNLYERSYIELIELKIKINNEEKAKKEIESERERQSEKEELPPLTIEECQEVEKKPSKLAERLKQSRDKYLKN